MFLGAQHSNMPDSRLIRVGTDYGRSYMQCKSLRIGGRESGGAKGENRGRRGFILRKCGAACARKKQTRGTGADLNAAGLLGAQPIAAKNRRADGCSPGTHVSAVRVDDRPK